MVVALKLWQNNHYKSGESMTVRAEIHDVIKSAVEPLHQALEDHAADAAKNNQRQDEVLTAVAEQVSAMQRLQSDHNVTISNISSIIERIDSKLDAQLLRHGKVSGAVASLRGQNKEQFERIVALETGVAIAKDLPSRVSTPGPRLLAEFFNNKIVQVGIMGLAVIIVYGVFQYIGVDVSGAKNLMTPLADTGD